MLCFAVENGRSMILGYPAKRGARLQVYGANGDETIPVCSLDLEKDNFLPIGDMIP